MRANNLLPPAEAVEAIFPRFRKTGINCKKRLTHRIAGGIITVTKSKDPDVKCRPDGELTGGRKALCLRSGSCIPLHNAKIRFCRFAVPFIRGRP